MAVLVLIALDKAILYYYYYWYIYITGGKVAEINEVL